MGNEAWNPIDREGGDMPPVPVEIQVIETLMDALELARLSSDPMLPRLIEAVLLHAGRELAKASTASPS
jgi:hypothetical protein